MLGWKRVLDLHRNCELHLFIGGYWQAHNGCNPIKYARLARLFYGLAVISMVFALACGWYRTINHFATGGMVLLWILTGGLALSGMCCAREANRFFDKLNAARKILGVSFKQLAEMGAPPKVAEDALTILRNNFEEAEEKNDPREMERIRREIIWAKSVFGDLGLLASPVLR